VMGIGGEVLGQPNESRFTGTPYLVLFLRLSLGGRRLNIARHDQPSAALGTLPVRGKGVS
jgi:hypothetical protein